MNIHIVTASAGTGKTTRLAELLDEAVGDGSVRPEAILATTFTKQAAAELLNRARTRLLRGRHVKEAQALLAARIGTVNAVCGSLVTDFAFMLGLSPELRVLDETGAELELKRALASVVVDEDSNRLQAFRGKFDAAFDWHYEVRRLIEAARANGIDADRLAASADRSMTSLDDCLGPATGTAETLDAELHCAIGVALEAIRSTTTVPTSSSGRLVATDLTKVTKEYCDLLAKCRRNLDGGRLRWGDWAKLTAQEPGSKSRAHAARVQAAAARHCGHPRLRADLHELIRLMFDVAADGLRAYQRLKQEHGLLDFVDQEVLALELLSHPDVRDILKDELDLVLVDEFQDTSPLQLAIFLKLAELARRSVWVGDPKQAIYGFRGTDPALMDAAIESLTTSPSHDPDLVAAAVDALARQSSVETLSRSYRSRPALVDLTNAIFAQAFSIQQNMPADRVKVDAVRTESPGSGPGLASGSGLGPALSHWPLSIQGQGSTELRAQAVAGGARTLLESRPTIFDPCTRCDRPATAGDLAILCRTNDQCLKVSEALGQLGIASVVARVGLLESAEAQVLMAGLCLWVDPRDRLAAATLVRILDHPDDAAAFLEKAFVRDGGEARTGSTEVVAHDAAAVVLEKAFVPDGRDLLARSPAVEALVAARAKAPDLDVLASVDAVIDVLDLRLLSAAWGEHTQRTANLDALRAHAASYCDERRAGSDAPSLVGFLAYLDELAKDDRWGRSRGDTIARVGSEDAVTVFTWHAAKGLEWPIVILFGLESVREPDAYGVHVMSDRATFDVSDPLGGRWIHFWPNPYTTFNQGGPVKLAYSQSDAHGYVARQAEREALRVLYVGWTRARDRLILAAHQGKLLGGLLGTLTNIEPGLINEPLIVTDALVDQTWAGHSFRLQVTTCQPTEPDPSPPTPGPIRTGRPHSTYAPAFLAPSSAPPRPAHLGEPVRLGDPIRIHGPVDVDVLGTAVHEFFAADAYFTFDGFFAGDDPHRLAPDALFAADDPRSPAPDDPSRPAADGLRYLPFDDPRTPAADDARSAAPVDPRSPTPDHPRRHAPDRLEIASGLLARYQVAGALDPADLLELADRLWRWVRVHFGEGAVVRTEWPLGLRLASGTQILGSADLLVETASALAVIDHKSFGLASARLQVDILAGQLGSYADAVARARPDKAVSTWVHLPLDGVVAKVE